MDSITREELKSLIDQQTDYCVSLFMPTYYSGAEIQQNQIRFRNLLRKMEDQLLTLGLRSQEVKSRLEPALALAGNMFFWRRQSDGLAIFLSPGFFRSYCLPMRFEESIFIRNRFHVKPLLPLLQVEERYHILGLSQKGVRFLEGTRYGVKEIELAGIPKNVAEAAANDEPERHIRFHSVGGGAGGAMMSGHGSYVEDAKENTIKYFRQIDKALHSLQKNEQAPLVLAGVDFLFPLYREVNTCPNLVEGGISGNPEAMSLENLHRQAWQIVEPLFQEAVGNALAQYRQSSGTGLASQDIKEIVTAAPQGRVGLLFVALDCHQWGSVTPNDGPRLQEEMSATCEDLLDFAAVRTFLNGGSVLTLPQEKMPGSGPLAAVFRY